MKRNYIITILVLIVVSISACNPNKINKIDNDENITNLENTINSLSQEIEELKAKIDVLHEVEIKNNKIATLKDKLNDEFHFILESIMHHDEGYLSRISTNINVKENIIEDVFLKEDFEIPTDNYGLRVYYYGFINEDEKLFQIGYEIRLREEITSLENLFVVFENIDGKWILDSIEKDIR